MTAAPLTRCPAVAVSASKTVSALSTPVEVALPVIVAR
jgi:hypothetical protein